MEAERCEHKTDLLVVGYGNTLRSDDGVGPRVAESVEALSLPGVRALSRALLTPELAEQLSQARTVIFVDASVEALSGVRLRPIEPAESGQILAHAADPRTMLALARDIFGHAPRAWWLTIPVQNIEIGEKISETAERGVAEAVEAVRNMCKSP